MRLVILSALKSARFRCSSNCWLRQNKSWFVPSSLRSFPRCSVMGAGGSTTCRSSPVQASPHPTSSTPKPQEEDEEAEQTRLLHHEPSSVAMTNSHVKTQSGNSSGCCDHREQNHAAFNAAKAGATAKVPLSRQVTIEDEIEEIVANTVDIANGKERVPATATRISKGWQESSPLVSDIQARLSPNFVVGMTEKKLQRTDTVTLIDRLPNNQPKSTEVQSEDIAASGESSIMETQQDIDFAKFRRANNRGSSLQRHGKIIHHQDSDLLWRLGLISPETYTMKPSPRSAPTMQGPFLKPPSYDLSEEQLMANIEKEFTECTSAI